MKTGFAFTLFVLAVGLLAGSVGHALLSLGMKRVEGPAAFGFRPIFGWMLRAASEPRVTLGIVFQGVFFFCYLFSLSRTDLSLILPLTAFDYVVTALIAAIAMGETVPALRWVGTGVIVVGILIVAQTGGPEAPRPGEPGSPHGAPPQGVGAVPSATATPPGPASPG